MPSAPKQPCRYVNCPALIECNTGGYCDTHKRESSSKLYDRDRGSAHSRGYDRRWQEFRLHYLRANPICRDCKANVATEVHHVRKLADDESLKYKLTNLLGLCKSCHSTRTIRGE